MPDAFEEQAVLVAAEQAAAEGDAIAAELHLRKLLDLQTARLGPEHAEVASTLHNLAVVCERASRVSEAEGLYRRAYAVAAAVLPPTDQLVVRCLDDLNAFLDARMMPRQAPPAARASASPASGVRRPSPSGTARTPARPPSRVRPPAPLPPPGRSSTLWTGVAIAGGVILAAGIVWLMVGRSAVAPAPVAAEVGVTAPPKRPAPAPKKAAPPAPTASAPATATPPAVTSGATPASSTPASPTPAVEPPPAPPAEPTPAASSEPPAGADVPSGDITVTDARLCAQLSTDAGWTCTAPDVPFGGGRLYFLTRIDVPETMQVEHRWLHGGDVIQSVRLRIQAAGRPGYRTYSRQTIDGARSGEWRAELRGPDGALLAEQRFVVQ